jgi:S-adenosylmethionine:tRNA ribosyltransferase-isomerase
MKTDDFDYHLPPELIAQRPAEARDQSRLLVVDRFAGAIEHKRFVDLPEFLTSGDVLVLNDTRVIKCRLFGNEIQRGGQVELLLVSELEDGTWETLAKPGRRAKPGKRILLGEGIAQAEFLVDTKDGGRRVKIESDRSVWDLMRDLGHVPLPPYIKRDDEAEDVDRYQTVYAKNDGAVAAPTAGLHFTDELLGSLKESGVETAYVTLHVGPGTFKPVKSGDPSEHKMDAEWYRLEADQAAKINEARLAGRAVCVGTTVCRTMETVARPEKDRWITEPGEGWTDKFIFPPYEFRIVDALVTNFHLPKTTLLMLVSALAGRELILKAYEEAVAERYRFYSYGDAMLIL